MLVTNPKMVLNTRPLAQQERLNQLLLFYGLQGVPLPLLEITPLADVPPMPLGDWDIVIFTSVNAVQHYLSHYKVIPKAAAYLCIGAATKNSLAELGKVQGSYPDQPDSEHLLAMPDLQNCAGKRIALISGLDGRDFLEKTLRERRADLFRCDVYERSTPNYTPEHIRQTLEQTHTIIITSGESLKNLVKITPPDCQNLLRSRLLATISSRIQDIALRLGFSDVIMAELADIPQKIKNHQQGRHYD